MNWNPQVSTKPTTRPHTTLVNMELAIEVLERMAKLVQDDVGFITKRNTRLKDYNWPIPYLHEHMLMHNIFRLMVGLSKLNISAFEVMSIKTAGLSDYDQRLACAPAVLV
jgi:hypothetical protein